MRQLILLVVTFLIGGLAAPPARADLATARSHLLKGDYKLALGEYKRSARGAERGAAPSAPRMPRRSPTW